jgi:hypothetical protein
MLLGLMIALTATTAAAASPKPSEVVPTPHGEAIAAVRAADPRFAELPDFQQVFREAAMEGRYDSAPLVAGSWIAVLGTFSETAGLAMGLEGWVTADTGLGLFVEVMLVDDCATPLPEDLTSDPCESRQHWVYHVPRGGEAELISHGEWPDLPVPSATAVPTSPTYEWGPMPVVSDASGLSLDAGLGPGTLVIGETCTTLEVKGRSTTLVWRDWQVLWDRDTGTIGFSALSSEDYLRLADGDLLSLSGYAPWAEGAGGPPAPPWLVLPGAGCPDDLMLVHDVVRTK